MENWELYVVGFFQHVVRTALSLADGKRDRKRHPSTWTSMMKLVKMEKLLDPTTVDNKESQLKWDTAKKKKKD